MPKKITLAKPTPRIPATVKEVKLLGDQVFCIRLDCNAFQWEPGDCIAVYGERDPAISRPYSLSGGDRENGLELWVRRFENGAISPELCDRKAGETIWISPPFGWFRPGEPEDADKLFFATGTGIAPFLSSIRSGHFAPRQLYWGIRHPITLDERLPLTLRTSCEGPFRGRVTDLLSEISFTSETHVYACGLDRMIEEVLEFFQCRGVSPANLHRECFFTEQDQELRGSSS